MAKTTVHGKDVRTYFSGVDLTSEAMDSSWGRSIDTAKRPRRGVDRVGYLLGHEDGKYSLGGYIPRLAASGLEAELNGLPEGVAVVLETFGESGRGKFASVRVAGLDIGTPAEDKASIKGDLQVTSGVRACEMLLQPQTLDGDDAGASRDDAAASTRGGSACVVVYDYNLVGGAEATIINPPVPTATTFTLNALNGIAAGKYVDVDGTIAKVGSVAGMAVTLAAPLAAAPAGGKKVKVVHFVKVTIQEVANPTVTSPAWSSLVAFDPITDDGEAVIKEVAGDDVNRGLRALVEVSTLGNETVGIAVGFERR